MGVKAETGSQVFYLKIQTSFWFTLVIADIKEYMVSIRDLCSNKVRVAQKELTFPELLLVLDQPCVVSHLIF